MGPAEHIDRLYFLGVIAAFIEVCHITGQCSRVARYVYDAIRFALDDGIEDRFSTTSPRRIKDDDVRADSFPDEFW